MKKRPNPILHMMIWGTVSGTVLAASYFIISMDFMTGFEGSIQDVFTALLSPIFWLVSIGFGGVPGAILGFFCGLALWGLLKKVPIPFTREQLREKRVSVYPSIYVLVLALAGLMIAPYIRSSYYALLFFSLPPFIAAIALTYAAHRYLFRLHLWSNTLDVQKSKAKNEVISRLSDHAKDAVHISTQSQAETQDYMSRGMSK